MGKLVLILLFSAFLMTPDLSRYNKVKSITGVWKVEQSAFRYPDSAWTVRTPPMRVCIFSRRNITAILLFRELVNYFRVIQIDLAMLKRSRPMIPLYQIQAPIL